MHLLLHPFTQERKKTQKNENAKKKRKRKRTQKNENAKKRKRKRTPKKETQKNAKKTKTHIFKNEDAYFQERRREKTKTKTQILGERCQLRSGEYCIYSIYI